MLSSVPASDAQEALLAELVRVLRPMFELEGGGVFRHHSEAWLQHLLAPFEELWSRRMPMKTMHGHDVTGIQVVARRR